MSTTSADMGTWSKWAVVVVVLVVMLPMVVVVIRRTLRGLPFRDSGISSLTPPSGPDIGGI